MSLADFLERERETILAEWVAFAATMLPAADSMEMLALRDHAPKILDAISADIRATQSRRAQHAKAQGRATVIDDAPTTAAEVHAVLRARSGFDINQLVAEYRALRASVIRLWTDQAVNEPTAFDDMMRFNEAIDQAIAESVSHFHAEVETARNLLLGMLGHDMRSPLTTVMTTAGYLEMLDAGPEVAAAAGRLARSGHSIKYLLDDLLDFSRTRLGLGLRIAAVDVDLLGAVTDEMEQLRGAHPDRAIELVATGHHDGQFDARRVQQLLRNLVSNALLYGTPSEPVRVMLRGDDDTAVHLVVVNSGRIIEFEAGVEMFDALKRGTDQGDGLGLGLFIVSAITEAPGGDVSYRSDDGTTTFEVRLPRLAPVR
jgi:signal transduction histidine kinase